MIGGEFDISLDRLPGNYDISFLQDGYLYSSGRAALYHILRYIKTYMKDIHTLMLPDYLCPSIITTALKVDFELVFYPLSDSFQLNYVKFPSIYRKNSAVLLINYFGLVSLSEQVSYLRGIDNEICIIEDNVQSFFSMWHSSESDFIFTSFRKALPLPDGGWVKTSYHLDSPIARNTFSQYKIAGAILKGLRPYGCFDDSLYLNLLETGEDQIDDNLNSKISDMTINLFSGIDLHKVEVLRKRNADYLQNGLKSIGIELLIPLSEGCVPLALPVYLNNRDKIRKRLFEHEIYCPVHWPKCSSSFSLSKGEELYDHELSLVIDQRYGLEDMDRILTILEDSLYGR